MTHSARFIPARELSCQLARSIEPRLREMFPKTPLALAFIGAGSDVLGYDTARSMDHDWGPRLTVLVPDEQSGEIKNAFEDGLNALLPGTVAGFPTRYSRHQDGTTISDVRGSEYRVDVTTVSALLRSTLLIDSIDELSDAVWLSTPMQSLLEITSGDVFFDDSGELTNVRRTLGFFPDHIWRYQLAGLWMRVSQISPFIGRSGEMEDQTGSAVIASTIARDLMRISLLQSRCYVPYPKWLGTACAQVENDSQILPHLDIALSATNWRSREKEINAAGIRLISQLNALDIIESIMAETVQFHSRPFTILPAERIANALQGSLVGTDAEHLPPFVGGIDIVTDSTDALMNTDFRRTFRSMFATSGYSGIHDIEEHNKV